MITAGDVARWVEEGSPALQGGFVHRVWRTSDAWVVLIRHHENDDPETRATSRVALEIALEADWARCVAVPPEDVEADDRKLKKARGKDSHPFLSLLRKHLGGTQVVGLRQVQDDRLVELRCERRVPDDPDLIAEAEADVPRRLVLAVELAGRSGNLILNRLDAEERPLVLGSLHAGRAKRPFEKDAPYLPPPARPDSALANRDPEVCPEVEPDPATLALGRAVAELQRARAEEAERSSRQGILRRSVKKARKRCQGVLKKLDAQLAEVANADAFERQADLIKANLGTIKRGMTSVTVTDYAHADGPTEVELTLDGAKDPQDQMKALYKRARKLRSGEASIGMRQGETDAKVDELTDLLERIDAADPEDEAAMDALEAAARKLGALPKAKKQAKVKQQENQGPRSYLTKEGHEILVGRSDDENDRLTMRIARGRDLFFHVAGCPGSHVILRVDVNRPPNHESLLDAAVVAIHYSKARNRGAADVHYTPRKWVKKPKGAKPGLVQISNHKTVRAGNDPERLRRVLDSARRGEETA